MVHILSEQPHPTIRSAPRISSAVSGDAKPPLTSRYHGLPLNMPLATAEVASSAPLASARRSSEARARATRAPRPATNTGRLARRSASARAAATAGEGCGGRRSSAGGTTGAGSGNGAACTSSGRLRTTVRRCVTAVRHARAASATAVRGAWTRSGTAPTARASPSWSTRKFERTAAAAVSAASTSMGVRLLAASVMPVMALVSPQPWCSESALTLRLVRA